MISFPIRLYEKTGICASALRVWEFARLRQMRDSRAPPVCRRRWLVLAGLQVLMFVGTGTQGHQQAAEHVQRAPVNATIGLLVPVSFRSFVPRSFLQTAIMALLAIHHVNTRDESVVGPDTVALLRQGFQVGSAYTLD